jgi:2-polyprenyl-3-methyl-5-hydroxy-6-metoxy-1,4-benzoquinol methylase
VTSQGINCPLCESPSIVVRYSGTQEWTNDGGAAYRCTSTTRIRPQVLECSACDHWFTNPATWPHSLEDEYSSLEDHEYLSLIGIKKKTFKKAADLVSQFIKPPATMIEVGSYAGLFLDEMRDRGFSVTGIEPSIWGSNLSQERGHHVIQGIAEDVLTNNSLEQADLVVSWDVLEHVADPTAFVALLASAAKPGGIVVISTLDRGNWFPRMLGKRWPWIIPMHLHYFDQSAMKRLGNKASLTFLHTSAHIHYATPAYALSRLFRNSEQADHSEGLLSKIAIPVGFGDVRTFIYRKDAVSL